MMAARNQYEGWMSKRFSRSNLNQSPNVMPPRILGPNHSKKRLRHDMIKSYLDDQCCTSLPTPR